MRLSEAALRVWKRCAAPGPIGRGALPSPILLIDCTGSHNTIDHYYRQLPLFINGPMINNIFLKIMIHYKKKSDLLSLDFTHKRSQNAGNTISETLNSNIFWWRIPPDLPTYVIILWGPNAFLAPGPTHT